MLAIQRMLANNVSDFESMRKIFLEVMACAKDMIIQARDAQEAEQGYE